MNMSVVLPSGEHATASKAGMSPLNGKTALVTGASRGIGRAATLERQTFKRSAQFEDIGSSVVFLASDAARWITGETLCVDGGPKI